MNHSDKNPDLDAFRADQGRHRARQKFDDFWGSAPKGEAYVPEVSSTEATWTKLDDLRVILFSMQEQRKRREANTDGEN
jgi:hypothetical protein